MVNDELKRATYDAAAGRDRLDAEVKRMSDIRAAAATPASVGPDIVSVAPARGAFQIIQPSEMVPGSTERTRRTGYMGRHAIRVADAFDVMRDQARRQGSAPPFTAGQISAGRDYQALVERLQAAGVRCSSLEGLGHGSSGSGSFSEAVLRDSQRLDGLRRRIGIGVAIEVRRIRPSVRGEGKRRGIPDRALVDMVCLGEKTLSHVLKAFGWSRSPKARIAVRDALCAALDRMQGY